eukprot:COSAG02_NODE_2431_length_8875_cov_9.810164_8_plen_69_part_00
MLTLFRVLELASGSITIDGIDISKLGLSQLRKAIAMLPQVPSLMYSAASRCIRLIYSVAMPSRFVGQI